MEKLYVNENFPYRVVELLRLLGHDVLTSLEAGNANQRIPDEEVLVFSSNQSRILSTLNRRDFIKLHFQNNQHSGIIVCTSDANFAALAERIHSVIIENKENFKGSLVRVNKGN